METHRDGKVLPNQYTSSSHERSKKLQILSFSKDYAEKTTFHGIHYVFHGRNKIRQAIWLIFFVACSCYCFFVVVELYYQYKKHPTTTKNRVVSQNHLTFPAVSICNYNAIRKSKLEDLRQEIESENNFEGLDVEYIRKKYGHTMDESGMLLNCTWKGHPCSSKDFFTSLDNLMLCHTFNSGSNPSTSTPAGSGNNQSLSNVDVQKLLKKLMASQEQGEQGLSETPPENMPNEISAPRFPSPLMSQQLRVPGRLPGDQGPRGLLPEPPRRGMPEFRSRGLLRTPGPEHRFMGPHGGPPRARFPGGPHLRHPMPGQRMPGPPMGRGGMSNRFPGPDGNRDSGDEFYNDQFNGENSEGIGRGLPPRGRGTRGRGRGRPTCRHFMSPRGCLRGNNCTFLHPGVNGPPV